MGWPDPGSWGDLAVVRETEGPQQGQVAVSIVIWVWEAPTDDGLAEPCGGRDGGWPRRPLHRNLYKAASRSS